MPPVNPPEVRAVAFQRSAAEAVGKTCKKTLKIPAVLADNPKIVERFFSKPVE